MKAQTSAKPVPDMPEAAGTEGGGMPAKGCDLSVGTAKSDLEGALSAGIA